MGETFMSAVTQIEDLFTKKNQIIDKAASLLAEAILDRIRTGNLTKNTQKDIMNAIRGFNEEEQVDILSRAIIYVGMNMRNNNTNSDDGNYNHFNSGKKVKSRSDIFRGGFDD